MILEERLEQFSTTIREDTEFWENRCKMKMLEKKECKRDTKREASHGGGGLFDLLPLEVIGYLLSFLNPYSIYALESTCWSIYTSLYNDHVWKTCYLLHYVDTRFSSILHDPTSLSCTETDGLWRLWYCQESREYSALIKFLVQYRDNKAGTTVSNAPAIHDVDELRHVLVKLAHYTSNTRGWNESTRELFLRERYILGLIHLLSSESHSIQQVVAVCIANILSHHDDRSSQFHEDVESDGLDSFIKMCRTTGGIKALNSILCSPDAAIQRLAANPCARALANLFSSRTTDKLAIDIDFLDGTSTSSLCGSRLSSFYDFFVSEEQSDWRVTYYYRSGIYQASVVEFSYL
jgi:hypothetical protein